MGSILCEHCTATCCRYLALPMDKPSGKRDYDDVRWYLMHENIIVFVEDGDWYVQFQTRCRNLGADNLCTVYETRPEICREYEPKGCDYTSGNYGYEELFTHPKQLEEFYRKKTGRILGTPKPATAKRITRKRKKKSA